MSTTTTTTTTIITTTTTTVYRGILMLGLSILEGREEENMLNDMKVQASEATLKKMCTAAASLLW